MMMAEIGTRTPSAPGSMPILPHQTSSCAPSRFGATRMYESRASSAISPPGYSPIEPDADPAARADIGRDEEAFRRRMDHQRLIPRASLAPHRWAAAPVMGCGAGIHRKKLIPDPKRRLPPRLHFMGLGESETELSQAG